MKYIIILLCFIFPFISYAEVDQSIPYLIATAAIAHGVDPQLALYISWKESQWNPQILGDHGKSRGLWQISKIYHPEVSDSIAFNPLQSTLWALQTILKDKSCRQWSTCPSQVD